MNKCEEMEYRLDYDQQLLHHISHISHSLLSNYIRIKKQCDFLIQEKYKSTI